MVEVSVAEGLWTPLPQRPTRSWARVAWGEAALAGQRKAAGGQWNQHQRLWNLRCGLVEALDVVGQTIETAL
jgi:hypothetical protein